MDVEFPLVFIIAKESSRIKAFAYIDLDYLWNSYTRLWETTNYNILKKQW